MQVILYATSICIASRVCNLKGIDSFVLDYVSRFAPIIVKKGKQLMTFRPWIFFLLVPVLASCTWVENWYAQDDMAEELIAQWPGIYAPAEDTQGPIQPYVQIRQVNVPAFPKPTLYMEIRDKHAEGRITRQRLFAFDQMAGPPHLIMRSYDLLADGWQQYENAFDDPSVLEGLSPQVMYRFPQGCEVHWRRDDDHFVGEVTRDRCHIPSRRNGKLVHADMVFTVTQEAFSQYEVIYNDEGTVLVGVPDGPPLTSVRVRPE